MRSEIRPEATTSDTAGGLTRRTPEAWLGAELAAVVASARRRAGRAADRQTDTAHLLHSLLESDPAVRLALAGAATGSPDGRAARALAYLAQRPIGYGMRWRGAVEESAGRATAAAPAASGLSPAALAALGEAACRAASRGGTAAQGTDLLDALAADPACRAAQVLRAVGVDPRRLAVTRTAGTVARSYWSDGPVAS